jgi:hypothetical protein
MKELANRLDGRPTWAVGLSVQDSIADKLLVAEKRLRRMRNGQLPAKVAGDEEHDWMN